MRSIEFLDTTLRDGEQTPGVNFSIKEKVAIAKQLERWGIASIEQVFQLQVLIHLKRFVKLPKS